MGFNEILIKTFSLFKHSKSDDDWELVDGGKVENDEFMMTLEASVEDDKDTRSEDAEFVVVVDRSGSMQGVPWSQVQRALTKMLELTKTDARIKVRALAYNYDASFLDLTGDLGIDSNMIKGIRASGSTNFVGVFEELGNVFKAEKSEGKSNKSYSIFFMTDGEDTCNEKLQIMAAKEKLQTEIEKSGVTAVFHVLGFSDSHDENFLESLTYLGTSDGTYSFVSPKDGEKALEENILSLLKSVSGFVGRSVNIEIIGENVLFLGDKPGETKKDVVLPASINKQADGTLKISTKKIMKMDGKEPKMSLKLHESKDLNEAKGKPATLEQFNIVILEDAEEILNHNLIKMRTIVNFMLADNSDADKGVVKKKYEALEKSFKKLNLTGNPSKATSRRKNAVETGLQLMKEIYDPSYGEYNVKERMLKKKAGYSEFSRKAALNINVGSRTYDNQTKAENSWHSTKQQAVRSSVQMKMAYADRSDSEEEAEPEKQEKMVKKVKSLIKKSKH